MKELSLFSGAGGGLLGTLLLGWRPVGYVEIDDYCQQVIAARIRDGILPDAPIFGNIHSFLSDGYAASYTGMVDVVTAGFPCQPFSLAGKRQGAADERNGWPATIECIRVVRPRYALLENVPGLLTSGYFGTVLGDLAASGFDCRWRVLSAAEVGAPHKRDRLWIVAHARSSRCSKPDAVQPGGNQKRNDSPRQQSGRAEQGVIITDSQNVADANSDNGNGRGVTHEMGWQCRAGKTARDGNSFRVEWGAESGICRVANGVAARVDRLKSLGNGQVPAVVRAAWMLLGDI